MTITLSGANQDGVIAAFTGCGTGELACNTVNAGATGSINFATTNGTTYYIQIQRRSGNNNANMSGDICAVSAPGGTFDDPCGATALTVGASCSFSTYSNATATASAGVPAPGCASYSGGDVWFTVTVPASGNVTLDMNTGVITDAGMAIYSGTCSSLSLIECDDDDSPNGLMSMIALTGQTPGATLWVRVWEYGNNNNGTFDICAYEPVVLPPPANDDCSGAYPVTVNASAGCASVTSGTVNSATASSQSTTSCGGTEDDDVWFSFVAPATGALDIDILNITGGTTDMYHSVWEGTCPSLTLVNNTCSDPNSQTVTGLTPGNTYYIRVYTWTGTTGQTSNFDVCLTEYTPPPAPANDDCSGAYPVTVNATAGCASVTAGTVGGATSSSQSTTACGGTEDDDVWFSFVAPATGAVSLDLLNITGGTTDLYHSIWEGTCPALNLVANTCSDPNSQLITGLTPGNTYYIRVYSWTSTTGQTSVFDVCLTEYTPPPAPANDDCSGAYPATVNASTCSTVTAGTIGGATASSQDATSCGGTEDDDVWFSFVAPASGSVNASLINITGGTTDLYHSVWEGTCPSLTLVAGTCSDPNNSTITGLTPGNTYYIRVYSWTSTTGQTSSFDLCLIEADACGGAANNDYCQAPAILTQGPGSFSSSTASTYSSDTPANVNTVFCGSIENNSWYEFTAQSTTEVFDITSVINCTSGIQAEVYEVTTDVNGCCTNFTSMSNCWNPATATTGTVTATGLTVGNTYILMIDGFGGDNCDFTISNWTATGILPVELVHFNAIASSHHNIISWQTETEFNNDYFRVMRSFDAENFEEIGTVNGKGNSSNVSNYQFLDTDIRNGETYYRLDQVDFDGTTTLSNVISLNRKPLREGFLNMYPNPANGSVTLELYNESFTDATIEISSMSGQTVYMEEVVINGLVKKNINIASLAKGVYTVVVRQANEFEMTRLIVE
ncbi:MAG: T9SS type A sorting domain-containing protein [bacterium]|nr:T9SS type A sorting domain-containing protein [bacterium]